MKSLFLPGCLISLALIVIYWVNKWMTQLPDSLPMDVTYLFALLGTYGMSHIFRMLRLTLLTLDRRDQVIPLLSVHALTALPSSLMPFKIGEILRLAGFFYIYRDVKAPAVWFAERFGDISVISLFILGLYVFEIEVPSGLRFIFIFFFMSSIFGLMVFFAVAKLSTYLNRYLVLSSSSGHGLKILKLSHKLRMLEEAILRSFEGRLMSIFLLSVFIWICEMLAMVLFLKGLSVDLNALSEYFLAGLSHVFSGTGGKMLYDILQESVLVFLTLFFGVILAIGASLRNSQTSRTTGR